MAPVKAEHRNAKFPPVTIHLLKPCSLRKFRQFMREQSSVFAIFAYKSPLRETRARQNRLHAMTYCHQCQMVYGLMLAKKTLRVRREMFTKVMARKMQESLNNPQLQAGGDYARCEFCFFRKYSCKYLLKQSETERTIMLD